MSLAPKKFLNETSNAVNEVIEGLLLTHPNKLQRLDGHDVVLLNPIPKQQKVHLLCGGGSGHEPCFGGYVGNGMLSGAVCGGIFASPSTKSVLAAIRAVTPISKNVHDFTEGGCLLIVLNYTGDRLNFGMACERANAEGRRCKMVIVSDDCAIARTGTTAATSRKHTGARGVAGCILVIKAAGAAAAAGKSLEEVAEIATCVADRIGSLGVALNAVTLPGAAQINSRLDGEKIEIGLGIHGEAGIRQTAMMPADEIAKEMVDTIYNYGFKVEGSISSGEMKMIDKIKEGQSVAIIVNNLGGTSYFELFLLARSIIVYLEEKVRCKVTRAYVGAYMTSFNMHGVSLSIFAPIGGNDGGESFFRLLDVDTDASAWSKVDILSSEANIRPSLMPFPEDTNPQFTPISTKEVDAEPVVIPNFADLAIASISAACKVLIECEPKLTEWDTQVGDGDCGITMLRGAKEVQKRLEEGRLPVSNPSRLFSDLADTVSASMGGTSGILFELMLRKMSTSLVSKVVDGSSLSAAFIQGVQAGSFYGGATKGCRTMMDALLPAADAASTGSLGLMATAASEGAESTTLMKEALAGRSSYLNTETLLNTPDPGAKAVEFILRAISEAVSNTL